MRDHNYWSSIAAPRGRLNSYRRVRSAVLWKLHLRFLLLSVSFVAGPWFSAANTHKQWSPFDISHRQVFLQSILVFSCLVECKLERRSQGPTLAYGIRHMLCEASLREESVPCLHTVASDCGVFTMCCKIILLAVLGCVTLVADAPVCRS